MTASDKPADASFLSGSDAEQGHKPLRLRASDQEDLQILSSLLQDALVPVKDLLFLREEACFAGILNRFCWERHKAAGGNQDERPAERILCSLRIGKVRKVRQKNIHPGEADHLLNLLSVSVEPVPADMAGTGSVQILLTFSGQVAIGILADSIAVSLEDLGDAWPTTWTPTHNPDA